MAPIPPQPAEDSAGKQGGESVDQDQPQSRPGVPQHPRTDEGVEEGAAAVVAKAQQQLRFPAGNEAIFIEPGSGAGSGGIPAQQSR